MILFVNSLIKSMKFFLFAMLICLNGCFFSPSLIPGFHIGAADVTIKSKELLSGSKCEWRCYKHKKKNEAIRNTFPSENLEVFNKNTKRSGSDILSGS